MIWLVNSCLSFYPNTPQREFSNRKSSCVREELSDIAFFFGHNFKRSLYKNIFLVSPHSRPLPLVRVPPQLILSPSPTQFLCVSIPISKPLNCSPIYAVDSFQRFQRQINIFDNPCWGRYPIFDSYIRLSLMAISFGVDKLKCIFLASSFVPYPSSTKRPKMQWKQK